MNQLKEKMQEYLACHPIDYGNSDAESVIYLLYTAYSEAHEADPPRIKELIAELDPILEAMPIDENNRLFGIIVQMCIENERNGFNNGLRLGTQLMAEISE